MAVTPARVMSFYIDLIDEHIEQLGHHLTEDVTLYWYGRTVQGKHLVQSFLSDEIVNPEHNITRAEAIPEIHYRDLSYKSSTSAMEHQEEGCKPVSAAGAAVVDFGSSPEEDFPGQKHNESGLESLDSSMLHNTPDRKMSEHQKNALLNKPRKQTFIKPKRPSLLISSEDTSFLEARGKVSFCKVGRYGCKRPWFRDCKLQLAYSCPPVGMDPISSCQFSLIIYSDEMKCRRNLCKVFDQMNIEAGNSNK